jgi:hypothetical protein
MAKERRKIIQAGRLWMAVQYTAIHTQKQSARREARSQISTPARESLNAKLSWQKLMLVLAANFFSTDLMVTLTYRDSSLPKTREEADRRLSNFIRALRAARRSHSPPDDLMYVRATEGYHTGGRLHHHLIINATGQDYALIQQLWKHGDVVDFEKFGADGAERWATYFTKEPREQGRRHVGDRTWRTSRGLKRPKHYYEYVDEGDSLTPPPGAFVIDKTECINSYGRFCHMMALLPEKKTEYKIQP